MIRPLTSMRGNASGFAVADILSGRIDNETSTGRTYLWGLVLERAWDHFPHGSGLGSAHNIIGGVMGYSDWLGVHNTLLMFLGEGGALPAAFLLGSVIALTTPILLTSRPRLLAQVLLLLLVDMMATHTALATRYHNMMLAFLCGMLAYFQSRRSQKPGPSAMHGERLAEGAGPVRASHSPACSSQDLHPGSPDHA